MRTVSGKMGEPPDFDEILRTLVRVALAAGDMILKGAESARVKKASGVNGAVKEKLNCMSWTSFADLWILKAHARQQPTWLQRQTRPLNAWSWAN